jgi:hypothetical protein
MNSYKLFVWTAQLLHGPSFDVSFIATTVDEARDGLLGQLEEIKQARRMDAGEIPPVHFEPRIHTDFMSDVIGVGLLDFTEDTELEDGTSLGDHIMLKMPYIRPLNLASIMVNSY